jgi:c-di-GMP-binding flagellar brake protein YcgR
MLIFPKRKPASVTDFTVHFSVNDAIQIEHQDQYYGSRVEEVRNDGLWISWPARGGIYLPLEVEQTVMLISSSQSGRYLYHVGIQERKGPSPALLKVLPRESLGQAEGRDFTRAPDTLPLTLLSLDVGSLRWGEKIEALTRNISAGGVTALVTKQQRFYAGERVELELALPSGDAVRARAVVIRCEPTVMLSPIYALALRFTEIQDQDQRRIVNRVFARQAELHRAGLL